MLNKLLLLLSFSILSAKTDWFITNFEYGKMLYNNPRGISCAKCHGEKGEGKIVTYFYKNGLKTYIKAPNIQNINLITLKKALFHKKLTVMPRYNYLTEEEIEGILLYLRSKK
ncbi:MULTISPECIES: c-type cytochrome [unclassified Lebetimonas]|uniref:c-type cytochrome n=1 Tax=unclassified Lebetimonas TaxID=2648158 RepID=UPI000467465C|nr:MULTISPECIES: cytochrome c [unclassified Lebetimonas]